MKQLIGIRNLQKQVRNKNISNSVAFPDFSFNVNLIFCELQEEIVEKKQIVEKVLDKLAYTDNVLVALSKTGLKTGAAVEEGVGEDNPILIVHPNYAEDE